MNNKSSRLLTLIAITFLNATNSLQPLSSCIKFSNFANSEILRTFQSFCPRKDSLKPRLWLFLNVLLMDTQKYDFPKLFTEI